MVKTLAIHTDYSHPNRFMFGRLASYAGSMGALARAYLVVIIETPPRMLSLWNGPCLYRLWVLGSRVSFWVLHPTRDRKRCRSVQHQGCSVLSRLHGTSQRSLSGVAHRTSGICRGSLPLTHIQRHLHTPCPNTICWRMTSCEGIEIQ